MTTTGTIPGTQPGNEGGSPTTGAARRSGARLIQAAPRHYPACLGVLHAAFGAEVADYGITAQNTPHNPAFWDASVLPALVDRGFELLCLDDGARIVGCALVGAARNRRVVWELRHLAVLPTARHHGYGERLVSEGASRARQAGASTLRIGVVAENRRLADWYVRLGFVTTESGMQYPGLPFTVDHLELSL